MDEPTTSRNLVGRCVGCDRLVTRPNGVQIGATDAWWHDYCYLKTEQQIGMRRRIRRQRTALRQLNRAYDRLRDSNSVLRHMLEVSEQTRKIGVSAGHCVSSDISIAVGKAGIKLEPWQKSLVENYMTHTMGAGRDYSKPMNHNHVKPCSCGIFDREAWNLANPGLRGMTAPGAWLDEGTPGARFIPFDGVLDAPWYRRAWDWLVFHTTRSVTPDEVDSGD